MRVWPRYFTICARDHVGSIGHKSPAHAYDIGAVFLEHQAGAQHVSSTCRRGEQVRGGIKDTLFIVVGFVDRDLGPRLQRSEIMPVGSSTLNASLKLVPS